jgi:hypothetical protein
MFYKDTDNKQWSEFFAWGDVGLPLSYMITQGYVTPKEDGKIAVNEVWDVFCNMISIDPNGKYESLRDAFDASPNDDLE